MPPDSFSHPLRRDPAVGTVSYDRGFTQYQCVLPDEAAKGAAFRFLDLLTRRGGASFLCVIKDAAAEGVDAQLPSAPAISIAVDFAVRDDTQQLIDALNELVIAEGGRIYPVEGRFTSPGSTVRGYLPARAGVPGGPRPHRPARTIRSAQSVRLFGDPR